MRLAAAAAAAALVLAAASLPAAPASAAAAEPPPGPPWASPLAADHPLAGTFWSTATGERLSPEQVVDRAVDSRVLLLGERHDNADHHALQAWLTRSVIAAGRRPAVVYEMMETDEQPRIDAWRRSDPPPADAAGLGDALDWETSGWPAWSLYAPMAEAALTAGLPILAGNLPLETVRSLARQGAGSLPPDLAERLVLAADDAPEVQEGLIADVRAGHCDLMPDAMLAPMALVQRGRDAMMAAVVVEGLADPATDMAILIAGNGHVREDRGVPLRLEALEVPRDHMLTVGPLEVRDGAVAITDYLPPDSLPPYDIVWFSPRADDVDHCAALRERMKNKNH
ncbi:ChaN family lipoprotein [Caenispirillum bisanense]|uniref:ChaN family lipoprotein n=1 Tax=Caenispirillum bisanense TaxID=414052 RepID=UPI0031D8D7CB